MRNGQNKRMRGRNRNKGHHHGGGGGGHHHHHNPLTRVYESNGPEVKIRGNAHHIAEKYLQLARDATASGDHVTAENHHQHAEHYFRLIAAAQEQFRQQNPYYQPQAAPGSEGNRDDAFDGDDDGDQPMQGQPMQGQPMQGQPPQLAAQGQPGFGQQPNYGNNQVQPYQPREQPPYGGNQQPHQGRPLHQQNNQHFQPQPIQQNPQGGNAGNDGGQLPSFITGGQPPQYQGNQNGYDGSNQGGDRFGRHRRRRHRGGGGGPRPDVQGGQQDLRGDETPDDQRPGNN
jgi:hypothetical protein